MSWSEKYSESDCEEDSVKKVNTFTGVYDSYDEELTFEELVASYRELCIKSEEVCQ